MEADNSWLGGVFSVLQQTFYSFFWLCVTKGTRINDNNGWSLPVSVLDEVSLASDLQRYEATKMLQRGRQSQKLVLWELLHSVSTASFSNPCMLLLYFRVDVSKAYQSIWKWYPTTHCRKVEFKILVILQQMHQLMLTTGLFCQAFLNRS